MSSPADWQAERYSLTLSLCSWQYFIIMYYMRERHADIHSLSHRDSPGAEINSPAAHRQQEVPFNRTYLGNYNNWTCAGEHAVHVSTGSRDMPGINFCAGVFEESHEGARWMWIKFLHESESTVAFFSFWLNTCSQVLPVCVLGLST